MKQFKYLLTIIIFILVFTLFNNNFKTNNKVLANTNDVEFENFEFSTEKTRENGKIKVKVIFSWDTKEEIIIEQISSKIADQIQTTENKTSGKKVNDMYHYEIEYVVQKWQIGTLELTIKYLSLDDPNFGTPKEKVFYIPGGKWVQDDVSISKAIIVGIVLTIITITATFILVENSRKGYMDSEIEE